MTTLTIEPEEVSASTVRRIWASDVGRRFRRNKLGMASVAWLLFVVVASFVLPYFYNVDPNFASIAGSVILVETIFAWPGVGRLLYIGIQFNDFPLVAGCIMVLLVYAVLVNLVVDLLYRVIDPRVRTEGVR